MNQCEINLSRLFANDGFPEDAFYIHKTFKDRKIVVYGAGESFHYFKEIVMRRYGYLPSVVLDRRFRSGDTFEGIPAFPPQEYHPSDGDRQNAIVIICLGNQSYYDEVVQTIRQMGFCTILSLNDIYEIHNPFCIPEELENIGFQYYLKNKYNIESCLKLFSDDQSRITYMCCMQTHLTRKPVTIPMRPRHEQYIPQDIILLRGYERFIYCGVSVGEMKSIFSTLGKIEELVCFEPDPNQFRLTADFLTDNHADLAKRITVLPCAVYHKEGIEHFTFSDTSFGSRILVSGSYFAQAVTIDQTLPGFNPTIITMDIEGAELEALKGAEKTIRASRPDLAICVYHSPAHLWEIPHYLHNLKLGYQFYLRNYTSFVGETVLYATID